MYGYIISGKSIIFDAISWPAAIRSSRQEMVFGVYISYWILSRAASKFLSGKYCRKSLPDDVQ